MLVFNPELKPNCRKAAVSPAVVAAVAEDKEDCNRVGARTTPVDRDARFLQKP